MFNFDELLNSDLPSKRAYLEAAEDDNKEKPEVKEDEKNTDSDAGKENKEDKEKDCDRADIADKVSKAIEDIEDVKLSKKAIDEFISGDEDKIEIEDLDEDKIKEVFDALSSLEDCDQIEIEKDDDEITISVKESSLDFVDQLFAMESEEDDIDMSDDEVDECGDSEECGATDIDECGEDDEDDVIDDALDELENQTDDDPLDEVPMDDETQELDSVEDKKADDMLAMVATPLLLKDELSAEESVNFYESVDSDIAVEEGLLQESSLDELYQEGVFASPNRPFKMTKQARMNQLYELSVQIEARAHRDPLMKKLDRAYAIERQIKKQLRKKYHAPAMKRAKSYLLRLIKSKSGVMKNLAKKIMPSK